MAPVIAVGANQFKGTVPFPADVAAKDVIRPGTDTNVVTFQVSVTPPIAKDAETWVFTDGELVIRSCTYAWSVATDVPLAKPHVRSSIEQSADKQTLYSADAAPVSANSVDPCLD